MEVTISCICPKCGFELADIEPANDGSIWAQAVCEDPLLLKCKELEAEKETIKLIVNGSIGGSHTLAESALVTIGELLEKADE